RELEGLYLVREGLESVAVRLCAARISPAQIQELKALGEQFESAVQNADHQAVAQLDVAIHRFIVDGAACPLLAEELSRLLLIERTAGWSEQGRPMPAEHHYTHRALIRAIVDRDADSAEYFMKKHIQKGLRDRLASGRRRRETP